MHFGCVELVEQHGSRRSSRRARQVERVETWHDEPSGIRALASLHFSKSYCVSAVLYGCVTWYLKKNDYHRHRPNVTCKNSFRKIFRCCRRESVSCLLFQCELFSRVTHSRSAKNNVLEKIMLYNNNLVLCSIVFVNRHSIGMITSNYAIPSPNWSVSVKFSVATF